MENIKIKTEFDCPYCDGYGWTSEHDIHPHTDGDCMGMCPVQVQCHHCKGTGKVDKGLLDDFNSKKTENSEPSDCDLPF